MRVLRIRIRWRLAAPTRPRRSRLSEAERSGRTKSRLHVRDNGGPDERCQHVARQCGKLVLQPSSINGPAVKQRRIQLYGVAVRDDEVHNQLIPTGLEASSPLRGRRAEDICALVQRVLIGIADWKCVSTGATPRRADASTALGARSRLHLDQPGRDIRRDGVR